MSSLVWRQIFSFGASSCLVVGLLVNLVLQAENKSFFGIGTRITGDQLLLKDVLQTPPISLTEEPVIKFNYAIAEPITCLEIESEKNVHAKVNFSYELNLVEGTISYINGLQDSGTVKPEAFEVLIRIYGFNETFLNINPAYILNKDQQFDGILKPIHQQKINQSLSLTEEDLKDQDDLELDYDTDDVDIDNDTENEEDVDYDEDDFNNNYDKIVEQGQRQEGDFLVYETNQTSATTTELPTNHSVTFYYIDIYHITYIKFTIYEHYLYHPLNNYDNTYVVEYAHISPTTLKAIVTDHRTTSLFVRMQMYGFRPTELPVDYKPFLSSGQTTERPMSALTQLKILMNAQQSKTQLHQEQFEQQQKQYNNTNIGLEEQSSEMDHQISPNDKSKMNCIQQVLSSSTNAGTESQRIFPPWSIFKFAMTSFAAMIIFM